MGRSTHRPRLSTIAAASAVPTVAATWTVRHRRSEIVRRWAPSRHPGRDLRSLHARVFGSGRPVYVLLHGLVASGDVFGAAAQTVLLAAGGLQRRDAGLAREREAADAAWATQVKFLTSDITERLATWCSGERSMALIKRLKTGGMVDDSCSDIF